MRAAALLALLGLTSACSVLLDPERKQCVTAADCSDESSAFSCVEGLCRQDEATWGCLAEPNPEPPPGDLTFRARVEVSIGNIPLAGGEVKACLLDDPECEAPLAMGVSGDDGRVDIVVPGDFDGQLTATLDGHWKTVRRVNRADALRDRVRLRMLTNETIGAFNSMLGVATTPSNSSIAADSEACTDELADGVSFSYPGLPQGIPFYQLDGALRADATQTAEGGLGGVADVQPGYQEVEARVAATGELIGRATINVPEGALGWVVFAARYRHE